MATIVGGVWVSSWCATQKRQLQLNSFGTTGRRCINSRSYVVVRYQSKNIMCDMNTILVFRYLLTPLTSCRSLLSSFSSYVQFVSNTNYTILLWLCLAWPGRRSDKQNKKASDMVLLLLPGHTQRRRRRRGRPKCSIPFRKYKMKWRANGKWRGVREWQKIGKCGPLGVAAGVQQWNSVCLK